MAYVAGTGGTLKSTSAEDALVELLVYIREESATQNKVNPVQMSLDIGTEKLNFSGELAVNITLGSNGKPIVDAIEVLS